jgi:hypothetical protein
MGMGMCICGLSSSVADQEDDIPYINSYTRDTMSSFSMFYCTLEMFKAGLKHESCNIKSDDSIAEAFIPRDVNLLRIGWFSEATLCNILKFHTKQNHTFDELIVIEKKLDYISILSKNQLIKSIYIQSMKELETESEPHRMQTYYLMKGILLSDNHEWLEENDLVRIAIAHGFNIYTSGMKSRPFYLETILKSQSESLKGLISKEDMYFSVLRNNLYSLGKSPELTKRQIYWFYNMRERCDVRCEFRNSY